MAKKLADKNCTIYLLRHGQTDWNVKEILHGSSSRIPLNQNGINQAEKIAQRFKSIKFTAVYSSDQLRARQTAEIIALQHQLTVITTKALRERNFGEFETRPYNSLQQELKDLLKKYRKLSDADKFKFDFQRGIETMDSVVTRAIAFLRKIAIAYPKQNILVTTHGGVIRTLLIRLGYATYDNLPFGSIDNTAYVKLLSDGVDFFIKQAYGVHKLES